MIWRNDKKFYVPAGKIDASIIGLNGSIAEVVLIREAVAIPTTIVYNLTTGTHNYVANNILISNAKDDGGSPGNL